MIWARPAMPVIVSLVCSALAGCGVIRAAATPPPTAVPMATGQPGHAKKVVLPAAGDRYVGIITSRMPGTYAPARTFSAATGARVRIAGYYSGWTERFQSQFVQTAWRNGSMTMVDMDPYGGQSVMSGIADGKYDWYLYQFAHDVAAFGHPVIINFGHEMNGTWFSYGYTHVQPATFVSAFRRMHKIFELTGARNVTWMWTVNIPVGKKTGPIAPFYPGNAYVDWAGIDGYDWVGDRTFGETFGPMLAQVRRLTRKPILIAETAVAPGPNAAMQVTSWLKGMASDHLLGFVWFDKNKSHDKTSDAHDWRLEDDPAALAAFRAALPAYLGPRGRP